MAITTKKKAIKPAKKPAKKPVRKKSVYIVVSVRGLDEYFKGRYTTLKAATEEARHVDSYLTALERKSGSRTEIWKNYDEDTGDIEKIYEIRTRRK